jgi:DHA1 family bicyclomycin/chloramphenicol resistance-like MFS transporter
VPRALTPEPSRRLLVAVLLATLAFGLLAMTICIPSMQDWPAVFDASQARVQLVFSGYLVTYGGLQLLYGPLSDRLGRKRVLLAGLALAGAASVLAAIAPDLDTLIAARVLQGAGSAAGIVVGRAMVQDLFTGPQRTRVMAYIGMAMGLCPPLATIVGGQLHVLLGWRANFVLMAVIAALVLPLAWRVLPDRPPAAPADARWLRPTLDAFATLLRQPAFVPYVAIVGSTTGAFYAFLGGAPLVLHGYGIGPDRIGFFILCIPVSYIVGNFMTSRLVHVLGERRMMTVGQALTVSGIVLMLGLGLAGVHTPLAFALPLMLFGVGHGLLVPSALAGTVGLMPALAGSAAGFAGVTQQAMGAIGSYAVGLLTHDGATRLGALMLGIACIGVVAQAVLYRLQPARP